MPARLGAGSAVSRASASASEHTAHLALPRIAHAERPVHEHLYIHRRFHGTAACRQFRDLVKRKLSCRHYPAKAHLCRSRHSLLVVKSALRRKVERKIRQVFMEQSGQAHVLHYDGVDSEPVNIVAVIECPRKLAVGYQSVDGHVDLYSVCVRVVYRVRQFFVAEVVGEYPGIESHAAHVYGVSTVVHGSDKVLFAPYGRQQFRSVHCYVLPMSY